MGGCCMVQQVGLSASFLRPSFSVEESQSTSVNNNSRTVPKNERSPAPLTAITPASSPSLAPVVVANVTTTTTTTAPPNPQYERTEASAIRRATIVVQLSGEMANNLHHVAHGLGLQLLAKEEFDIDCNIVLRHHEGPNNRSPRPKWKSARDNIQMCFPNLAKWHFAKGNTKDFLQRQNLQREWLGKRMDHMTGLINSGDLSAMRQGLEFLVNDVLNDPKRPLIDQQSELRIPYLYSETLDVFPMIDRYYDQIRELMRFNDTACCAKIPDPDDSVFHFRNYESEMPERRAYDMGFAELSHTKVSNELFSNLQSGDHVEITTRIYNQKARNYAEALVERGINASVVTDQSAVQDFCFLKRAQKEVVGNARSTFVMWAALLGNARRARLYHVDNLGLRQRHPNFWERFSYNFTHPSLRDRLTFELYHADE